MKLMLFLAALWAVSLATGSVVPREMFASLNEQIVDTVSVSGAQEEPRAEQSFEVDGETMVISRTRVKSVTSLTQADLDNLVEMRRLLASYN